MTDSQPSYDELKQGHVILAPDPFKETDEATRPWVVINNETHPFDGEQYVVLGLTTRTWYERRIPLADDDFRHRQAPKDSSIVPHAVASLQPNLVTDYICRIRAEPLEDAIEMLLEYL